MCNIFFDYELLIINELSIYSFSCYTFTLKMQKVEGIE